jgi:aspartyl-tRNA(Asn)/glutamyl-tRNA(Gln) amidotransferase subunit A
MWACVSDTVHRGPRRQTLSVTQLIDFGVVDGAAALRRRQLSATEWVQACLDRIDAVDGDHSHDGDAGSINAWVRVYADDALVAAAAADQQLARGTDDLAPLLGVPLGLKDLYEVAGKPITASSTILGDVPVVDCDVWRNLRSAGMILIGHTHTHEFAAGGTTDQVGNPYDLRRSAGGSSGGSAAALAAHMVPAATGTDTAGSLRIPSACCGTSTIKPTRGLVSTRGIVPLSWTLDHAGPMARSIDDCRALLAAMLGVDARTVAADRPISGARVAISPRVGSVDLDGDVAAGFERSIDACRELGATIVEPAPPDVGFDVADDLLDVMTTDMLAYHRRFDHQRDGYRPSLRGWVEIGEARAISGEQYAAAQSRRQHMTWAWSDWLRQQGIDAVIEPTIPVVAPERGSGYETAGSDYALISLTAFWDWTGFPVVAHPAGLGRESGLPVGVSLIGAPHTDATLLTLATQLSRQTSS